jgi:hypothetical protein
MQKRRKDGHTLSVANDFKYWLRKRGEDLIADGINGTMWRPSIARGDAGTAERHRNLKAEFDAERRQRSEANERIKEIAAAKKAIPENEFKKQIYPKRHVPKGFGG